MIRQMKRLTGVSLCNLFGVNEFRFTKDKKKKSRYYLMSVLWAFLLVMMAMYIASLSYGLCHMKMGELVPAVLSMLAAAVMFLFTMFKAGPVLFDRAVYERQITLPVTVRAVIISRFLSMYLTNMLMGVLLLLPGMAVQGIMERPGAAYYLYGILGGLFLPLLPLTAASVFGALIAGISSRWKKKNLVAIVLSMLFVCVILVGSVGMSRMEETELEEVLLHMAELMRAQVGSVYLPALWISEAMLLGKGGRMLLFLGISIGFFVLFLEILRPFYEKICSLFAAGEARGNYRMKGLSAKSVRRSMVERELRRYFSSTVYVTNTLVGEVLMVFTAIAVAVMGKETIENMVGMPGILERALPVMLGAFVVLTPISSSSVSMEGRSWWLMQTLPVREKDILLSKAAANLVVVAPFYLVSEIILIFALKPGFIKVLYFLTVPALYTLLGAVAGVLINRKFPVFDWENETRVVKQSVSTFLSMLFGVIVGMGPLALLILFYYS